MKIKGTVVATIFHNEQNGYSVLDFLSTNEEELTVVGSFPSLNVGEGLELEGEMIVHAKFGAQFQAKSFSMCSPDTLEGIVKYLSSGLIKGVGVKTAEAIVGKFKKLTLEVIEKSPEKLSQVKGVSLSKAQSIAKAFVELKQMQSQLMFLQNYNITTNLAMKIFQVYKDKTVEILSQNPYKLIDDVEGIGFLTADKIAVSLGLKPDSPFRTRAGVIFVLGDSGERSGNTFLFEEDLYGKVQKLLNMEKEVLSTMFGETLQQLQFESIVNVLEVDGLKAIALSKFFGVEKAIAGRLVKMDRDFDSLADDFSTLIQDFEKTNNVVLHKNQVDAIVSCMKSGVSVITGGPGTGKTTIIKCIAHIMKSLKNKVEFCTPTGRAAKRLGEASGEEAKTIHRMLGVEFLSGKVFFFYNEHNPLDADVVVVDEVSMVDCMLFNALLKSLKRKAKLILVGDKDQLPSVGAGNVLSDIISSGLIQTNFLTHIYRQSSDSLIVSNAHNINHCKLPIIKNDSKDFFFLEKNSPEDVCQSVLSLVSSRLPKFANVGAVDIQVLAPMKQGPAGTEAINTQLQDLLNPPSPMKGEFRNNFQLFRLGDKVMQTQNDYQLEWTKPALAGNVEQGQGVFNGDIGFVSQVNTEDNSIEVCFEDNRHALYMAGDVANLMLSYAITIHKSQGSEFDVVVIPLSSGPPSIVNKNLLYTAVTRAKKLVCIVSSKKQLTMTVKNNYIIQRNTLLPKFLIEENQKSNLLFGETC